MNRLSAFLIVILLFSCEKDSVKMPVVGKWIMVERSGSPGCGCWLQVIPMNADILEFTFIGKYKIKRPLFVSSIACPGRYRLINDSTIGLTPDCGGLDPSPEAIGIYSESTKQLTIEYNYPSGVIKHRYIKL